MPVLCRAVYGFRILLPLIWGGLTLAERQDLVAEPGASGSSR